MNDIIILLKNFSAQIYKKIQPFLIPHFPLLRRSYFSTEKNNVLTPLKLPRFFKENGSSI